METAALWMGDLETRASRKGGRRIKGRFPYKSRAVLSDGGRKGARPQKEQFESKAFAYRVNKADEEIHLLVGHSYDKPLASKLNGTLRLVDSADALTFEADISPQIMETTYGADIIRQIESGLAVGISPGFRLPPPRAVAKPEAFTDEGFDPSRGMYNALIRTIFQALLFELSVVTVPAYKESSIEALPGDTNHDGVLSDAEKLAAGWTWQNGALLPPPQENASTVPLIAAPVPLLRPVPIIKPVRPAIARYR